MRGRIKRDLDHARGNVCAILLLLLYLFNYMSLEKLKTPGELASIRKEFGENGRKLVFTNGCFDLLHVGHVRYLAEARTLGDALLVAVNGDTSVSALKGPTRPINSELERAEVLASLECVSYVTIFRTMRVTGLIEEIRPQVYAKGGDYTVESLDAEERTALQRRLGARSGFWRWCRGNRPLPSSKNGKAENRGDRVGEGVELPGDPGGDPARGGRGGDGRGDFRCGKRRNSGTGARVRRPGGICGAGAVPDEDGAGKRGACRVAAEGGRGGIGGARRLYADGEGAAARRFSGPDHQYPSVAAPGVSRARCLDTGAARRGDGNGGARCIMWTAGWTPALSSRRGACRSCRGILRRRSTRVSNWRSTRSTRRWWRGSRGRDLSRTRSGNSFGPGRTESCENRVAWFSAGPRTWDGSAFST